MRPKRRDGGSRSRFITFRKCWRAAGSVASALIEQSSQVRTEFAADSLLEEAGFEPSVPLRLARSGHVCRGVMGIRGRAGASHRVGRAGTRDRVRWPRCHAYDDRRPASAIGTAMVRQVEALWCSLTMMSSPTSVLRNRNFDPKISHRLLNRYLGNRSSSARRDSALFEHRTDV